jgi:hypothetical protein
MCISVLLGYCSMFLPFREVEELVRYSPDLKSGSYLMMRIAFVLYTIGGIIGGVKWYTFHCFSHQNIGVSRCVAKPP